MIGVQSFTSEVSIVVKTSTDLLYGGEGISYCWKTRWDLNNFFYCSPFREAEHDIVRNGFVVVRVLDLET
jgi:hypothetical protein